MTRRYASYRPMRGSPAPLVLLAPSLLLLLTACESQGNKTAKAPPSPEREVDAGLRASEASVARATSAPIDNTGRPAAVIAGAPVSDADIRVYANELAGGVVLEEIALDRLLRQRMAGLGLSVNASDVDAEKRMLLESIARDAETSPDLTRTLLERLQRQRGLGPKRFAGLLERNAMLRRIVEPSVTVTDDQVEQAMRVRYGERRIARIIVRNSQQEAAASLTSMQGLAGVGLSTAFTDEASRNSVDPSSARGGMLEPISVSDPAYPGIVRTTLAALTPGQMSTIIALDRGFAIVLLESIVPAASPPSNARELSRTEVTRRAQRVAMDRLARDLLQAAGVTPMEDSLRWSWENRADVVR